MGAGNAKELVPPPVDYTDHVLAAVTLLWFLPMWFYLVLLNRKHKHQGRVLARRKFYIREISHYPNRRPIVGGNWKCNPDSPAKISDLVKSLNDCSTSKCDVFVCPSPLHVSLVQSKLDKNIKIACQNCNFSGSCGAYTGEIAAEQISAMGLK